MKVQSHRGTKIRLDIPSILLKELFQQIIRWKVPKQNTNRSTRKREYQKKRIPKKINRKFISGPLFQTARTARMEPTINTSGEINPKNTACGVLMVNTEERTKYTITS